MGHCLPGDSESFDQFRLDQTLPALAREVVIYFALGSFSLPAVTFLENAEELIVTSLGLGNIVIGYVAPNILDVALQLIPFTLEDILIHGDYLSHLTKIGSNNDQF